MSHLSSTDHRLVSSFFLLDSFPKGPGRWHFNESLLDDDCYIDHMSKFISAFKTELNSQHYLDKRLYWDMLKIAIRDETTSFSRLKSLEKLDSNNNLEADISNLNEQLVHDPNDPAIIQELLEATIKKELIELSVCRGALKRSKLHEIEQGERNTKFFLGIEKSRQTNRVMGAHGTTD